VFSIPIAALVIIEETDANDKDAVVKKEGVFIAAEGRCVFRNVKKGISGDMYIEITSGLKENETVITGPFAVLKKLKIGDKIRISEDKQ
jgi:HlyD family secretion protein